MAAKQLIFGEDARRRLSRGMETLATAVATATLDIDTYFRMEKLGPNSTISVGAS